MHVDDPQDGDHPVHLVLITVFAWMLAPLAGAAGCTVDPDWVRRAPDTPPHHGPYSSLLSAGDAQAELPLGVGHIHPAEQLALSGWLDRVTLPLSDAPEEPARRLLVNGWLIDRVGAGEPLPFAGLIETEYEQSTLLVLQERNGWYQVRVKPPIEPADTAWTPACALANSDPPLFFSSWAEWLMSEDISPLYFRRSTVHNLRTGPGTQFAKRGRISGDHVLRPRRIEGDWMEVMVSQPSDYCERASVQRSLGWVRWRSAERGPWVWYYTRGC